MEQVHRHMAPRARSRRETDSELFLASAVSPAALPAPRRRWVVGGWGAAANTQPAVSGDRKRPSLRLPWAGQAGHREGVRGTPGLQGRTDEAKLASRRRAGAGAGTEGGRQHQFLRLPVGDTCRLQGVGRRSLGIRGGQTTPEMAKSRPLTPPARPVQGGRSSRHTALRSQPRAAPAGQAAACPPLPATGSSPLCLRRGQGVYTERRTG